MIFWKGSHVDS